MGCHTGRKRERFTSWRGVKVWAKRRRREEGERSYRVNSERGELVAERESLGQEGELAAERHGVGVRASVRIPSGVIASIYVSHVQIVAFIAPPRPGMAIGALALDLEELRTGETEWGRDGTAKAWGWEEEGIEEGWVGWRREGWAGRRGEWEGEGEGGGMCSKIRMMIEVSSIKDFRLGSFFTCSGVLLRIFPISSNKSSMRPVAIGVGSSVVSSCFSTKAATISGVKHS
jgi:hypothetical protein